MRILFASDVYFPRINGVSTSIQTFRAGLAALGHEVVLVAPAYPGATRADRGVVRVPSRYVPLDPEDRAMRWRALDRAGRMLAAERFDLVHVHTPFLAHYAALRIGRRMNAPVVATYHTLFEEYLFHYVPFAPRGLMRVVARRFSRVQCNALDAVVVPSVAMRETLTGYGVSAPLEIIPTGIPLEDFSGGDGARFRARHGIEAGRPMLLFVGRVAFEKNIGFLLRMLVRVRDAIPDVLLVICGEGPAERSLRAAAHRSGIDVSVRFVGYLDRATELLDCYRAADTFVFASRTETQGLVLLEAMAAGVPVVSTALMGTRDIVGPGKGALVPEDREDSFAEAVVRVLRDPELRKRLASEAIAYAQSWSAPATVRRMESFYSRVISARQADAALRAVRAG